MTALVLPTVWTPHLDSQSPLTVNSVAPGFIATEMTEQLSEDIRKKMSDQVALNRLGDPQDIANAVSFLASDKANYITGTVMHVNGGLYMS